MSLSPGPCCIQAPARLLPLVMNCNPPAILHWSPPAVNHYEPPAAVYCEPLREMCSAPPPATRSKPPPAASTANGQVLCHLGWTCGDSSGFCSARDPFLQRPRGGISRRHIVMAVTWIPWACRAGETLCSRRLSRESTLQMPVVTQSIRRVAGEFRCDRRTASCYIT